MNKSKPEDLLAAGLHLGHKAQKLHPRSRQYIYKLHEGSAIIDLFKTVEKLDEARNVLHEMGKMGKKLLVVATKKQARQFVSEVSKQNGIFYITNKWTAGLLTNFPEISKNIKKLKELKEQKEAGEWAEFVKHEQVALEKKINKIASIYEGVSAMESLPDVMLVLDIKQESTAIIEAAKMNIPTIAVVDTNCNPDLVTYAIPANDDAVSSITYLINTLIDAYVSGLKKQKEEEKETPEKNDDKS